MRHKKHRLSFFFMTAAVSLAAFACNSRPTYDIQVFDFKSDCAGNIVSRFEFDPEPEAPAVKFEPAYIEEARALNMRLVYEENQIKVLFGDSVVCTFAGASTQSECLTMDSDQPAGCSASRTIHCLRYPSRGPGYRPPFAEPGKDCFPPPSQ